MTSSTRPKGHAPAAAAGPKYHVNIEGVEHDWDRETITVPELRALGGLPANTPVDEIDLTTNTQRTLREDEMVELRPGLGFAKKTRFQRG